MVSSASRFFTHVLAVLVLSMSAQASPQRGAVPPVKPLKKLTLHNLRSCLLSIGNYISAGTIKTSTGAIKNTELRHTIRREKINGDIQITGLLGTYRLNPNTELHQLISPKSSALPTDSLAGAFWVKEEAGDELEFFVLQPIGTNATKVLSVKYTELDPRSAQDDLVIHLQTRAFNAGGSFLEFDAFQGNDPSYDLLKGEKRTLAHGPYAELSITKLQALLKMLSSETNRLLDRIASDLKVSDTLASTASMKVSAQSALKIAQICEMGKDKVSAETKPAANRLHKLSTEILRDLN